MSKNNVIHNCIENWSLHPTVKASLKCHSVLSTIILNDAAIGTLYPGASVLALPYPI